MPRNWRRKIEIDDLVKLHINNHDHVPAGPPKKSKTKKINCKSRKDTEPQIDPKIKVNEDKLEKDVSINPLSFCKDDQKPFQVKPPVESKPEEVKCKSQKATNFMFGHNLKITRDKLEEEMSMDVFPSCSYQSSSTESCSKVQTNDILLRQSGDSSMDEFHTFGEELHELNEEDIWEQLGILQTLHRKEIDLKTAILHEKLKQEEEFITDEKLLKEKISKLEDEVHKNRIDLRLKETMCSEVQLMETLRKITLPHHFKDGDSVKEVYDFSDSERAVILGHLLKKEQLKRQISSEQQKIAKIEENCRKMKLAIEKCENKSTPEKLETVKPEDWKELECLKNDNQKRGAHIQLFAKLVQHLIENVKTKHILKDDMIALASACEQIQHWNYEDVDEMEELCKKVYSTKI